MFMQQGANFLLWNFNLCMTTCMDVKNITNYFIISMKLFATLRLGKIA